MATESFLSQAIAEQAHPLAGRDDDLDALFERIGDARFVLLGEATHGTHEFYRLRAEITKRLIADNGFSAVAAEADWPDAARANRYVLGARGADCDAERALADFRRFPQWMWRNSDVVDFLEWVRGRGVGFYGLDLYSLHASMAAVLAYLDAHDPPAATRARTRYRCFDAHGDDPGDYGRAVWLGLSDDCERAVLDQLEDQLARRLGGDAAFDAEQNARVVAGAEAYYRKMYLRGGESTWNLRDTHMADTLDALADHLARSGRPAKVVVWAHNSHVGDSEAMSHRAERDEITIGHLCRERHPGDTVLVGFTTHAGTVTAASDWGGPAERKRVRPALARSYEAVFHDTGVPRFLLMLGDALGEAAAALREPRLERAIGVVYRPQSERASHYFAVDLVGQLDAVIHVDRTRAIEPLERTAEWTRGELPETFPSGV